MLVTRLIMVGAAFLGTCDAGVIDFLDNGGQLSATLNGAPISDGGIVSNLAFSGQSVIFDLLLTGTRNVLSDTAFTQQFFPGSTSVSDIFLQSFSSGSATFQVRFGAGPDLPSVPTGAIDLTTVPPQGLPPDPYYEDGTLQKVGTVFFRTVHRIRSSRRSPTRAPRPNPPLPR